MWCYNIYYVMSVAEQGYFSMFLLPHESSIPYSMSGVNVFCTLLCINVDVF